MLLYLSRQSIHLSIKTSIALKPPACPEAGGETGLLSPEDLANFE
jgi:hypothetical protein